MWSRNAKWPWVLAQNSHRAVGVPAGSGGMRLDVALVDLAGVVLPLHDGVGFGETGLQVSRGELEVIGDVGNVSGLLLSPTSGTLRRIGQGDQALVDRRGAVGHGLLVR